MARLVLDYTAMMAPRLGGRGIRPEDLDAATTAFAAVQRDVDARRAAGRLAFFDLPREREIVDRIRAFADGLGQAFDTIVVLGIGGSALGTTALRHALCTSGWNELHEDDRDYFPRLYVLDNIDPATITPLLDRLDLNRTLFNVVSKSGTTAETMAQFLVLRDRMRASLGDGWRGHFLFTTDPEKGVLRALADAEGVPTLPIPPGVGGRFSVLSAVGLLPAALVGIDIDGLLAGAAEMDERCRTPELTRNPAALFAVLQHLADTKADARIHVMMPYSDRLYACADWFRQLWAESLGKRTALDGREVFVGPTPVAAIGATDQHSQVQLYIEGPFDKTITFLAVRDPGPDLAIPAAYPDVDALAYLSGHGLGELLEAERVATAAALADAGRMNMTIELPAIDEHAIGQLLMMLQIATVYAGALYGVDPLDQPGVEHGKRLTYGLMGRPGHARPEILPSDPARICDGT